MRDRARSGLRVAAAIGALVAAFAVGYLIGRAQSSVEAG